jgi:hypothetical protein
MNTNKRIFKYPLMMADLQVVKVPAGGVPLSVIEQHGTIVMYVRVPEDNDPEVVKDLEIRIVGTGQVIEFDTNDIKFLGTVPMEGGDLIWHVFFKDHGYWPRES